MTRRRPSQAPVSISCHLSAGRTGELGGPADQRRPEEGLEPMQLCHAGGVVMQCGGVIGLRDEGVPHGGRGSRLSLETRGLSVSLCREQQSTGKHQHEDQYEGLAEALREQHRVIVLLVSRGESAGVETNDQ